MADDLRSGEPQVLTIEVRPGTMDDAARMAPRMRTEDVLEVFAASGRGPLEALEAGVLTSSKCMTATEGGEPFCMFGVVTTVIDEGLAFGSLWLLGTDRIKDLSTPFLRQSRTWLLRLASGHAAVGMMMDARNTVHHRWASWLGFRHVARHPHHGAQRLPFDEYVLD